MKKFNWKYTQYSQFNQSDTLLLVSGVHFGSPNSTSGEIAVFTVDGKGNILHNYYLIFMNLFLLNIKEVQVKISILFKIFTPLFFR